MVSPGASSCCLSYIRYINVHSGRIGWYLIEADYIPPDPYFRATIHPQEWRDRGGNYSYQNGRWIATSFPRWWWWRKDEKKDLRHGHNKFTRGNKVYKISSKKRLSSKEVSKMKEIYRDLF
jgi:hypothetical protein